MMSKKNKNKNQQPTNLNEVKQEKQVQQKQVDQKRMEFKNNIITVLRLAIKDRMDGVYSMNVLNLMEQMGMEPILIFRLVDSFIRQINSDIDQNKLPAIKIRQLFYQQVIGIFAPDEPKDNVAENFEKAKEAVGEIKEMVDKPVSEPVEEVNEWK